MDTIRFSQEIPIAHRVGVCVVGAGPAGCAAATVAAEQGAEVLLVESGAMCGGMSTAGRVPVFMPWSDGVRMLCEGYGRRILQALKEAGKRHDFEVGCSIQAEHLKLVYEQFLEEAGAQLLYYSRLAAVRTEEGRVRQAVFAAPSGMFAVEAEVFIDATGDGTLAAWAGAPFERGDESGHVMPSTLCSVWTGFDWDAYRQGGAFSHNDDRMPVLLEKAFRSGLLPEEDYHHTGVFRVSRGCAVGNFSHVFDIDATDEASLTEGLRRSRKLLARYETFYRTRIPGFDQAEIIDTGSVLGVRESRRILGDYVLTREDYDARRSFDDEIGRYNFPADLHPIRPGKEEILAHKRLFRSSACGKGESYGIPYRALLPRGLDNVLTCGRCVSTDRHVQASLRVIPGAYITGQAAGMAASLSLRRACSPRALPGTEVRAALAEARALPGMAD
ncbi:MAG: FAD-dependent oxidoreductase [Oligosphaeraceae bacterium]